MPVDSWRRVKSRMWEAESLSPFSSKSVTFTSLLSVLCRLKLLMPPIWEPELSIPLYHNDNSGTIRKRKGSLKRNRVLTSVYRDTYSSC